MVLDNLGLEPPVVGAVRQAAAAAVPGLVAERVLVAATHTHSGPSLSTRKSKDEDELIPPDADYVNHVLQACTSACEAARISQEPVTLRVGLTEAREGHNRRVVDAQGTATNVWLDGDGSHIGFFNPVVRFAIFETVPGGKTKAAIDAYACHPVTLGPANLKVHADYPGYLTRILEAETGAELAVHVTSGGANINPKAGLRETDERAREMGEAIAEKILACWNHGLAVEALPVKSASASLAFPLGPDAREHILARAQDGANGKEMQTEVQAIRLGDMVLVSAPGELFSEIGMTVENLSPLPHTFVVAYGNDYLGYLFTDTARREGGYEPNNPFTESIERPYIAAAREAMRATV